MDHNWHPLTDLPANWDELASAELRSLARIWEEQRDRLRERDAINVFNQRLAREWAIETGVIENVYQLDRGVTALLIERGLDAALIPYGASDRNPEEVVEIVRDHERALEGLFSFVKQDRPLSNSYVRELHQTITTHQRTVAARDTLGNIVDVKLVRGEYKKMPNNPMVPGKGLHEYCPPVQVDGEMDRMLTLHEIHVDKNVPPEIEAAWLHHRFTQIHPFQDGNGRVARALASLVLIRAGYFPLLVTRESRLEYLDALAVGDQGDLAPLVALFSRIQRGCFTRALSLSHDIIEKGNAIDAVMGAAMTRLRARYAEERTNREQVIETSRHLEDCAYAQCQAMAKTLTAGLQSVNTSYTARAKKSDENSRHWYTWQIAETAKELGYFADYRTYRAWTGFAIYEERATHVVLSFHCLGTEFLGVMAVSAFEEHKDPSSEGENGVSGERHVVCREPFNFSHLDDPGEVVDRFSPWLTETITLALDQWRRQL